MFTNSEVLKSIIEAKGLKIYDIFVRMGRKRSVYKAFEENTFNKKFISDLEKIICEDLSIFINS